MKWLDNSVNKVMMIFVIILGISFIYLIILDSLETESVYDGEMTSINQLKPGIADESMKVEIDENIEIEIMSKDYTENKAYLLKAKIDGEQVGIVYFDENGKIQFEGNQEKFEYALIKAFKIREEYWRK